MKLVNMKQTATEEKTVAVMASEPDKPRYPWGLSIHLDNDTLDKLGMKALPDVGAELTIGAKVKVTSVSANEYEGEGKRRTVSLQITDLGVDDPTDNVTDLLYGKSK